MEARTAEIALLADSTGSASSLLRTDQAMLRKLRYADDDTGAVKRARRKVRVPNGKRH
jgi:hypothetical protein